MTALSLMMMLSTLSLASLPHVIRAEDTANTTPLTETGGTENLPEKTANYVIVEPLQKDLDFFGLVKKEDNQEFDFVIYQHINVAENDSVYFYGYVENDEANTRGWYVLNADHKWELIATDEDVATVMDKNNWRNTADYSANIQINSWGIYNGTGNELSPTNMAEHSVPGYKMKFNWQLTVPGGGVLHENDTIVIPVPQGGPKAAWSALDGSYENFYQGAVLMGKWRFHGNKIEIIFGANAEGHNSISGVDFTSGDNSLTVFYSGSSDFTENVTFQGQSKLIGYKGSTLIAGDMMPIVKGAASGSNSEIAWFTLTAYDLIQNSSLTSGLAVVPLGQGASVQNNAYIEDTIPTDGKFSDVGYAFYAALPIPVSLSPTSPAAVNGSYAMDITARFTKRTDGNSFSSYAAFKASLNPFEWGVYNNPDNTQTVVVYYGNIGNNGMTYDSLETNWADNAANYCVTHFYADTPTNRSILKNWFTNVYGNGNVFHGSVTGYNFHFNIKYDKVVSDTNKNNSITYTHNGVSHNATGTGTMQGILGNVMVSSFAARAYKIDTDTLAMLPGATIKLQQSTDGGNSWHDHGAAKQTNGNGFVEFTALGVAKYRFVETAAAPDYDLTASPGYDAVVGGVVSSTFDVLAGETEGHKLLMENKKVSYKVTYDWGVEYPSDKTIPVDNNSYTTKALAEAAVDTTFTSASTSTAPKNGVNGTWYFSGWDSGTWTGNTIKFVGTWHFVAHATIPTNVQIVKEFDLVNGQQPSTNKTFTFTITPAAGSPAVAAPTSVSVTGAGVSPQFGNITFTQAGTFTYKVKETQGNDVGYTYDNTEWTVTYKVSDVNGVLTLDSGYPQFHNGTTAEPQITFTNKYLPTADRVKIPLEKIVTGDSYMNPFNFKVEAVSTNVPGMLPSTMPMLPGAVAGALSVNRLAGVYQLGEIEFTQAGVYRYRIDEIAGSAQGVNYDHSYYEIEITVTDNNGVLEAEKVVRHFQNAVPVVTNFGFGVDIQGITFRNHYTAPTSGGGSRPVPKTSVDCK